MDNVEGAQELKGGPKRKKKEKRKRKEKENEKMKERKKERALFKCMGPHSIYPYSKYIVDR